MASGTLEEKKSEDEALFKDKDGSKVAENEGQPQHTSKDGKKENEEVPETLVSNEDKENLAPEEKDVEKKHVGDQVDAHEEDEEHKGEEDEEHKDEVAKEEKEEDVEEEEEHHAREEEEEDETPKKVKRAGRTDSSRKRKASSGKKQSKESVDNKEKEPVTPGSERPYRERKMVERYSITQPGRSATKPVSIEQGRGTQLKDIPNVAFKLSKRKPDDNLQMLHTILFGKKAKAHNLKKNIGQFSGYVWTDNEEKHKAKVREKIDKCVKEKLVDFCDVLNIPINKAVVRKEELTVKLLEFLESPHATTDVLLADKEQKGKKRKAMPGKNVSPGEDSATPAKKRKRNPQSGEKRKRSSEVDMGEDEDEVDSPEAKDAKDDSQDVDESEAQKEQSNQEESKSEEEEDEPKEQPSTKKASKKNLKETSGRKNKEKVTPAKKRTPAKSVKNSTKPAKKSSDSSSKQGVDGNSKSKGSASKKHKIEKESPKEQSTPIRDKGTGKKQSSKLSSKAPAKDQGKAKSSKKAKAEPTREDMHAVVVDILKEVDFNTATLSDILRQLGTHFGVDLMHRKAEVKDIITEVINNMSDEEDDGEEVEDNAEAGNDADKHVDGDDNA